MDGRHEGRTADVSNLDAAAVTHCVQVRATREYVHLVSDTTEKSAEVTAYPAGADDRDPQSRRR